MSASDRSFNEKRDFIRMKINSTVKVTHAGNDYQGTCKDLSGAGMSILTETQFNVGDEVELLIEQEGDTHLPFHASAEVTRVEPEESGNYMVGLSIREIAD
jgi:c-di-GMP-binding flagellar brake protein YcgR